MPDIEIAITGMTCGHCKSAVERAARSVPGVTKATADLTAGKVSLTFDGNASTLEAVKKAIAEAGYRVP